MTRNGGSQSYNHRENWTLPTTTEAWKRTELQKGGGPADTLSAARETPDS